MYLETVAGLLLDSWAIFKILAPPQLMMPNLDRASRLLQDLPALWKHPGVTAAQQRGLAREVFQEVRLREGRLVAVRPRPRYAPLFA